MNQFSLDCDTNSLNNEKEVLLNENVDTIVPNKVLETNSTQFVFGQSPKAMKRVVIADDSRFMREYLKTILRKNGYLVVGEAADGESAVELYQKYKPDLVILDITMPKKTGIESLKEIKQLNENAKVVICSSMGQKFFIQEAYDNGAIDFIVKPFEVSAVVNTVKKIFD